MKRGREVPDERRPPEAAATESAATEDGTSGVNWSRPRRTEAPAERGTNPAATVRGRLRRLLHRGNEGGRGRPEAPGPARGHRHRDVGIGPRSEGGYGLDVELHVFCPASSRPTPALVEAAHQNSRWIPTRPATTSTSGSRSV